MKYYKPRKRLLKYGRKKAGNRLALAKYIITGLVLIGVIGMTATPASSQIDLKDMQLDLVPSVIRQLLSPTPTPLTQPTTAQDIDRWERLKHAIRNIAPIYGLSPKLGIAQAALESAHGTSQYCVERNNCFGIAAYTDNPDAAWYFNSIEEGVIEYYRLQRNNFPEAWAAKDNPDQMLQLLENNSDGLMYATDPDYVYKIESLPEWSQE